MLEDLHRFQFRPLKEFSDRDSVGLVQGTKTPQGRKYEKITKKIQIPHPGLGPEKTKKLPKKYKNAPEMTIFVFFR